MRNNNRRIIRRLSGRSLKNNRMRNLFAVIAVTLTALLFTTLFSLGLGMLQITQEQAMRRVGTWAHAGLKNVTREEYERITSHPLVKDKSYEIRIAMAKNDAFMKRQTEINYIEPKDFGFHFKEIKEGNLPQGEKEAVVDTIVMDMLGLPHETGVKVPLEFDFMGKHYEETFTVSGWYEGDPVMGASQVYLSKAYLDRISEGYTEEDFAFAARERDTNGFGLLQSDIVFKDSRNIEDRIKKVISESGYDTQKIHYGVNWAYFTEQSRDADPMTVFLLLTALFVIILTGYLIIYNIFQISIIKDIRFYGLLKTIGATKRQIRSLIRRQAYLLSCIGIPVGLMLGYLIGRAMLPYFLRVASGYNTAAFHMKANPRIFLFGAVFSMFTVLISCRKPGKIAGDVSPVEAVKYSDIRKIRRMTRHTVKGAGLSHMALANMAGNKKKTAVVVLSLSLSVILLAEVVTFSKSFSLDKYLESMISGDFQIGSVSLMNYQATADLALPEEFYQAADNLEGIESAGRLYYTRYNLEHTLSEAGHKRFQKLYDGGLLDIREGIMENSSKVRDTLERNAPVEESRYAYDEVLLGKLKVLEGVIDLEKFRTGRYILVGTFTDKNNTYYKPGDIAELQFHGPESELVEEKDKDGNTVRVNWINNMVKSYEVMAVVDIPSGMTVRRYPLNALYTILPVQELLSNEKDAECFAASFQVRDDREKEFEKFLSDYTSKINPNTDYESKESLRDEFKSFTDIIRIAGGALSLVIAIIGILNFINTMLTGVIARKREFAMLQSIGLTNRQLKKMLLLEGMYYVAFTAVISFVIGSVLSVSVIRAINNVASYFEYRFTAAPFAAVLPAFLMIALAVPLIAYRSAKKQSIVERLRETE